MKERRMFDQDITVQPESRKVEGYAVVKGTNNLYVEKGVEGTPAI